MMRIRWSLPEQDRAQTIPHNPVFTMNENPLASKSGALGGALSRQKCILMASLPQRKCLDFQSQ